MKPNTSSLRRLIERIVDLKEPIKENRLGTPPPLLKPQCKYYIQSWGCSAGSLKKNFFKNIIIIYFDHFKLSFFNMVERITYINRSILKIVVLK